MWTRIWSFFTIFDAKIGFYGVTNLKVYTDIQSFYSSDQKTVETKTRPVIGTSRVLSSRGRTHWAGALTAPWKEVGRIHWARIVKPHLALGGWYSAQHVKKDQKT